MRKKLDQRLREVRRGADLRPTDPTNDRPSLSAGADPSDVESDGAFADLDGARRFRQNASPGMATPEGDDDALSRLAGGISITAGDGETRHIGAGEIVLVEDTTGKGHITRSSGDNRGTRSSCRSIDRRAGGGCRLRVGTQLIEPRGAR